MHRLVTHMKSILDPYWKILTEKDKQLLKTALTKTYGEFFTGELGEYEFLRDVEGSGKENSGQVIQLITDYIIWSHGCPRLTVTPYAFVPNHPLQQFIRDNYLLVRIVPEVITHYIESQGWILEQDGLDESIVDYVPKHIERGVNIE